MKDGIKNETVKRGADYIGRCAVYENGKRLYSFETGIRRVSRGDALKDAQDAARDLIVKRFEGETPPPPEPPVETCPALDHEHHEGANYYVSCIRNNNPNDCALLAGPYKTHGEALAMVRPAKNIADEVDPRSHWYGYGTVAMAADFTRPGKLNDLIERTERKAA